MVDFRKYLEKNKDMKNQVEEVQNSLVPTTPAQLAVQQDVPDYLKSYIGDKTGKENITADDMLIPRLGLAQALSPQLKKSKDVYIDGLEVGDLFDTVTSEIYGSEVSVIPLWFEKNYIEFKSIKDGGGVVKVYDNLQQVPPAHLEWGSDSEGKGPRVTAFSNFMCLLSRKGRVPKAIYVSFKSTGIKMAKRWLGFIQEHDLPMFAYTYNLEVVTKSKGDQEWEGLKVTRNNFVPEEFLKLAKQFTDELKAKGAKIDTTGLDEENDAPRTKSDEDVPF